MTHKDTYMYTQYVVLKSQGNTYNQNMKPANKYTTKNYNSTDLTKTQGYWM